MNQTIRFLQQENARLSDDNQQLQEESRLLQDYLAALGWLVDVADEMSGEDDLFALLDKMLYYALTLLDAAEGSIILKDQETDELVFTLVRGAVGQNLVNFRFPSTEGITGWVVTNGSAAIVNEVQLDPRFSPKVDELFHFQTRSMLSVPLKSGDRVLGALNVLNKHSGDPFADIDKNLLTIFAWAAAFALVRLE